MSLPSNIPEEIEAAASVWLARRDRGLAAAEQDAYLEWLYTDPLHGRAIVQLERVWVAMNQLEQWRPAHSRIPNPDLLAPRLVAPFYRWVGGFAAAAVIAFALYIGQATRTVPLTAPRTAIVHPAPEKLTLADGSIVELNQDAKIAVAFTASERRVQLLGGEAYFTVAHNVDRPFFVDTGRVSVRAVGTAFSVTRASDAVGVLVTEGKVQVIELSGQPAMADAPGVPPTFLTAGQRAVVNLAAAATPVVQEMTPAEMDRALSWQAMRLEFVDLPLRDVVAEFNRYNRRKLVVTDAATAGILVAGNFRADNVDAFVRLLDSGFGITAFPHGDEIVLRKTQ